MSKKISMNDALETLQSMFPHIEKKVLKTYIFKTNGHMEKTVELLLSHTNFESSSEMFGGNQVSSTNQPTVPPVSEGLSESMFRHNVPDDFLRWKRKKKKKKHRTQMEKDEQLAKKLQRQLLKEAKQEMGMNRQQQQQQQQQFPQPQQMFSPPQFYIPGQIYYRNNNQIPPQSQRQRQHQQQNRSQPHHHNTNNMNRNQRQEGDVDDNEENVSKSGSFGIKTMSSYAKKKLQEFRNKFKGNGKGGGGGGGNDTREFNEYSSLMKGDGEQIEFDDEDEIELGDAGSINNPQGEDGDGILDM